MLTFCFVLDHLIMSYHFVHPPRVALHTMLFVSPLHCIARCIKKKPFLKTLTSLAFEILKPLGKPLIEQSQIHRVCFSFKKKSNFCFSLVFFETTLDIISIPKTLSSIFCFKPKI